MASGNMTVEVAAPQVAHGGLVEVLDSLGHVHDVADPHLGLGVVYEKPPCGPASLVPGLCDDALGLDPDTEKDFDSPDSDESLAFGIYKGVVCSPFFKNYEKRTTDALRAGASVAVETAYQALILDEATLNTEPGPYSVVDALARLEQIIAEQGGGVISVSRFGATYLANTRGVKSDDNHHLWTAQGTPIINGGGISVEYDSTEPSGANGFFMWATSVVDLYRGPVIYTQAKGLSTNTEAGLAEQLYSIATPCYAIAIEVDPEGTP